MQANQQQMMPDQRSGVHMQGQANQMVFSQSAQRNFEN